MNLLNWYKKTVSEIKETKEWKSVPYLQGVIIGFLSSIEELQKENDDLRNNKGVWLSPEKLKEFEEKVKDIRDLLTPSSKE